MQIPYLEHVKGWWQSRAERERLMLGVGGVILGLFVLYSAIWSPLSNTASEYRSDVITQRALLIYLQNANSRVSALRAEGIQAATATSSAAINLLTLTEQTLAQHQLSAFLKGVQQQPDNKIQLTFVDVPMDRLMGWVQQLLTTENVKVDTMTADRQVVTGTADVTLVLMTGSVSS